jgi:hypothetical protein
MAEQLEPQLRVLLDNIGHARAVAHAMSRRHRPPAAELLKARKKHLAALEQYAAEVERRGWPLPTKVRIDMHLLRSLCGLPLR